MWTQLTAKWAISDDGSSIAWAGGDFLYALHGEENEGTHTSDFASYQISTATWQDRAPIECGIDDGGSLAWGGNVLQEQADFLYVLCGAVNEEPGRKFLRYSISQNAWEALADIPCPIGFYTGSRLGFAKGNLYYWQGSPQSEKWACADGSTGGNKFFQFPIGLAPTAKVLINEFDLNPPGNDSSNATLEWVELFNGTNQELDLQGWTVSTTAGASTVTVSVTCSGQTMKVKPIGYCVVERSRWLDNEGEQIILRDAQGKEIDRTLQASDDKNDTRSWSRCPNGKDTDSDSDWRFVESSKGGANKC